MVPTGGSSGLCYGVTMPHTEMRELKRQKVTGGQRAWRLLKAERERKLPSRSWEMNVHIWTCELMGSGRHGEDG